MKSRLSSSIAYRCIALIMVIALQSILVVNSNAQCPVNPGCTIPAPSNSLPATHQICDNGNKTVTLDPKVAVGGTKYQWYKDGVAIPAPDGQTRNYNATAVGTYSVCYLAGNSYCYGEATTIVTIRDFANEVKDEFPKLKNNERYVCSDSAKSVYTNVSPENPLYTYSWSQGLIQASDVNIKNAKIKTTYSGVSVGAYSATLTVSERTIPAGFGCSASKKITVRVYPDLRIDIPTVSSTICQNQAIDLTLHHLFVSNNINSATVTIGSDITNISTTDFTYTTADKVTNNLGVSAKSNVIGVAKPKNIIPFQSGTQTLTFKLTTDSGCVAPSVSKIITVSPTTSLPLTITDFGFKNRQLCVNENKVNLKKSPTYPTGKFAGPGVDTVNNVFDPSKANPNAYNRISYTLTATGGCGQSALDSVYVSAPPKPYFTGPNLLCPNSKGIEFKDTVTVKLWSRQFSVVPSPSVGFSPFGANTIKVDFPDTLRDASNKVVNTAKIIVKYFDPTFSGCENSDTVLVNVNSNQKSPTPQGDTIACLTFPKPKWTITYTSNPSTSGPNYKHKWNASNGTISKYNADSSQIEVTWNVNPSPRTLTVIDSLRKGVSCFVASEPININFINPPTVTLNILPRGVCEGVDFPVSVSNPNPSFTYTWSPTPTGAQGGSIVYIKALENKLPKGTGQLEVSVTAKILNSNCPESQPDTKSTTVYKNPIDPLPQDIILNCFDDTPDVVLHVDYTGKGNGPKPPSVEWNNDTLLNSDPLIVTKPSTVSVKVTNTIFSSPLLECSSTGSVQIVDNCGAKLFMPRAFSPNGDGANDSLKVFGKHFLSFDFKVFSRWGEVVFSTNDYTHAWGGDYGGAPMPSGTYPYVIVYESFDESNKKVKTTYSGSITLIR